MAGLSDDHANHGTRARPRRDQGRRNCPRDLLLRLIVCLRAARAVATSTACSSQAQSTAKQRAGCRGTLHFRHRVEVRSWSPAGGKEPQTSCNTGGGFCASVFVGMIRPGRNDKTSRRLERHTNVIGHRQYRDTAKSYGLWYR